jgi:predicted PurR-regulated permease PerM
MPFYSQVGVGFGRRHSGRSRITSSAPFPTRSTNYPRSIDILKGVHFFDLRTARVLATIAAFVAVGALLYGIRHTLVIFLFAIFFAYLVEPVVTRIQHTPLARNSRPLAIAGTYLIVAVLLGGLAVLFGPKVVEDMHRLSKTLPTLLENVTSGKIVWQLGQRHNWSYDTQYRIEQFIAAHRDTILNWMTQAGSEAAQLATNVIWVVLIPILAVFFLAEGGKFAQAFIEEFDRRDQRRLLRCIVEDLDRMMARFIFSQIMVASLSLCAYGIVLTSLNYPYSLALAVAGGMMEFIPVAGPAMAAAAILGVGFLAGFGKLWLVVLFLGLWRLSQDYIVTPRIMGHGLELHPLAAIAAVLMGGELGGILGVYLSIPIAAAIRVVWNRWRDYARQAETERATLATVASRPPQERIAG